MPEVDFASVAVDSSATGGDTFQSLTKSLGANSLGLSRLELRPGQRMRVHRHERQEEVYFVLSGTLTIALEDGERALAPGTLARVGPAAKRQLINRGAEPAVVLALGAAGEHVARDARAWHSWEEGGEGRPAREVPMPPDLEPGQ